MNSEIKRTLQENITYLKTDVSNKEGELAKAVKEVDKIRKKIDESKIKIAALQEGLEEKKDGKKHGASEEGSTHREVESKSDKDGDSKDRGSETVRSSEQGDGRVQGSSRERPSTKKRDKSDKGHSAGAVDNRKPEEQHTETSD